MATNPVITAKQALQITRGRTPLVPIEYEEALKNLSACVSLDEAKYWDNKADALAAWAKIYRSDKAGLEAKRLKLHAYRRMGALAEELRPKRRLRGDKFAGMAPGPMSALRESGLTESQAVSARRLARMDADKFTSLVAHPSPPSPSTVRSKDGNDLWVHVRQRLGGLTCVTKYPPAEVCRTLTESEKETARRIVRQVVEWLDEFERHLSKQRTT